MIPYLFFTYCLFHDRGIPLSINQPMVKLHVYPDKRNKCKHVAFMIHENLEVTSSNFSFFKKKTGKAFLSKTKIAMWGPQKWRERWFRFTPATRNRSWNWTYVNPNLAIDRGPHIVWVVVSLELAGFHPGMFSMMIPLDWSCCDGWRTGELVMMLGMSFKICTDFINKNYPHSWNPIKPNN